VAIFVKIFGHKVGFWPRNLHFLMFSRKVHKNYEKIKWAEPGIIGQVFSKIKRP
jgi:hypothetical protein